MLSLLLWQKLDDLIFSVVGLNGFESQVLEIKWPNLSSCLSENEMCDFMNYLCYGCIDIHDSHPVIAPQLQIDKRIILNTLLALIYSHLLPLGDPSRDYLGLEIKQDPIDRQGTAWLDLNRGRGFKVFSIFLKTISVS